jgi:8-oxo-dGTP pyrophosphatase MutT (NUDIX family)
LWKFPKGHKDFPDEDEVDVAVRELREETGIEISRPAVIASTSFTEQYFYERIARNKSERLRIIKKINTFWLGQVASHGSELPEVTLDDAEFIDYKWASYQEVVSLLPENSRSFFEDAHNLLVKNRV